MPALAELAGPPDGGYWSTHQDDAYPLAGHFFAFLRRRCSDEQLCRLYGSHLAEPEVQSILGMTLEHVERDWRAQLAAE